MNKDFDLSFEPHPITRDVGVRKGVNAIFQSIRSIVLTAGVDIPFDSNSWGDVDLMLGENISSLFSNQIETHISEVLRHREPRIEVTKVTATPFMDHHGYNIRIEFIEVNNPQIHVVEVPLSRLK